MLACLSDSAKIKTADNPSGLFAGQGATQSLAVGVRKRGQDFPGKFIIRMAISQVSPNAPATSPRVPKNKATMPMEELAMVYQFIVPLSEGYLKWKEMVSNDYIALIFRD